jgi:hypothetical protein
MEFLKFLTGGSFSQSDYKDQLGKFTQEFLNLEHSNDIDKFLQSSEDFANVFTTVFLEDFRNIKE